MKKFVSTSLIINFLSLNLAMATEKPLPPLPAVTPRVGQIEQIEPIKSTPIKNGKDSVMVQPESRYLKSGQDLTVELIDTIDSRTLKPGQIISAKLLLPVDLNGKIVIPEGALIKGKVMKLERATNAGKNASTYIHFDHIEVGSGYKIPISGKIKTLDNTGILSGGNYRKQLEKALAMGTTTTAGGVLAGLGVGLLSSAVAVGSFVGLIVGGVLGFGWLFLKKGKPVNVPAGTNLLVNLEYDVAIKNIGL